MSHTPGPWMHEAGPIADLVFHANGIATLATVHHGVGLGDSESHANARLIAAAPDMLEALKLCIARDPSLKANAMVSAAITKAEGKT